MENEKQLKQALNEVLEIESGFFEYGELTAAQKEEIVTKIIRAVKDKEGKNEN